MKIRMLTHISGLRDGVQWPPLGAEIVVPDAEGAELCAAGYAYPVAEPQAAETRAPRRGVKKDD